MAPVPTLDAEAKSADFKQTSGDATVGAVNHPLWRQMIRNTVGNCSPCSSPLPGTARAQGNSSLMLGRGAITH